MAKKAKRGLIVTGTCLALGLGVLNLVFWSKFRDKLIMFQEQKPAMCVDGRQMNDSLSKVKFVVDDTKVDYESAVTMRCGIPVAVYPCNNTAATSKVWDDCLPSGIQPEWPTRALEVGITCVQPGGLHPDFVGGNHHCDQKDWTCNTIAGGITLTDTKEPCDAYEMTRRLCGILMQQTEYFCYHAPGHESVPIEIEKTGFPYGWCIAGSLTAATTLFFLYAQFFEKKKCKVIDHWAFECANLFQMIFAAGVMLGFAYLVVFIIQKITGADKGQNIKASEYLTLQQTMWPYNNVQYPGGPANFTLVPEDPMPEGLQWWHWMCIVLGSMCGFFCLTVGFLMWKGGECTKHQAWRLEDDSEDSVSESD